MASNAAKVLRRANALNRLSSLSKLLSENLGIEMADGMVNNRDPELAEIQRIENINDLLEKVLKASDVEVPEVAEPETDAPNTPDTKPVLSEMTKAELLEYADSQGIEVTKSKTKTEIIEAIQGA